MARGPVSKPKAQVVGLNLCRSITVEQIQAGLQDSDGDGPSHLQRQLTVREWDEEARTVEIAFSSEEPVERWFGSEVLDHGQGAVRLDRLRNGGPLLSDHDGRRQIGVVERVDIDADRVGRATVRFSRSTAADEVFRDVVDRIKRHVSVGYQIHRIEVEVRQGQSDLVRVIDWEPFEISFVSVPADLTVGVGRQAPTAQPADGSGPMKTKILRDGNGNLVRAKVDDDGNIIEVLETIEEAGEAEASIRAQAEARAHERVEALSALGRQYNAPDLALAAIEAGTSEMDFQRELLEHMNSRGGPSTPLRDDNQEIGLTEREIGNYSFLRALRALSQPTNRRLQEAAAFEREASEAAAGLLSREVEGFVVPTEVLRAPLNSSTTGSGADSGGFSIATNLLAGSFVDLLRNQAVMMRLCRPLGGLVGNVDIPRQASGASGYWIGEDEEATEDVLGLDQIGMTPKTVAAYSEITRKLLMQSSLDTEALVRFDLASALGLTIDKAAIYGSGTGAQPLGIVNTTGVNVVDFGSAGQLPSYTDVVAMETEIASDNADVASMAYVQNAGMRGHLKTTEKFAGTSGRTVWEDGNTVNGYGTEVTNQMNAGDMLFGNFMDALIGMWGGLELTVDPYSESKRGRLRIVAMQDVDFVLRRVESFCLGRGIA